MKKLIVFILGLVFVLAGCGKIDKNFIEGTWKSDTSDERMTFDKDTVTSVDRDGENPETHEYRVTDTANDTFLVDLNLGDAMMTEKYTRVDNNKIELDSVVLYDNNGDKVGDGAEGGKTFIREGGGGFFSGLWTIIKAVAFLLFLAFAGYTIYYALREKRQNKKG